jgi:uncharacterized protein
MVNRLSYRHISLAILSLKALLVGFLIWQVLHHTKGDLAFRFDGAFFGFVAAGFVAQLIDGALGMAYGVSCTTLLLNLGIPPAIASTGVHTAEVFTTGASGLSHLYLGNVDKKLFIRLIIPGVIGAMLGAYLLSEVFDGHAIRPFLAAYLLFLGVLILRKSIRDKQPGDKVKYVSTLGFSGGLLDAIGGGGWGPIVTTNILRQGNCPRETIATVNTAEFFVAFFSTGVFLFFTGVESWQVVLGLVIGGLLAAPIGAWLVNKLDTRKLMFLVGFVIVLTQGYTLGNWAWKTFF